ncbi:hypothetical protein RB195_012155 [Necator americanus]|uniref:Reverse transcriptase domain-containing protein n=1 Tax=Necator americanus TaxID=51031 RepID=A0ABR1D5Y3_NECAM
MHDFKLLLINTSVNQILGALLEGFLQQRMLPSGSVLALLPVGPCRYFGPMTCFVAYNLTDAVTMNVAIGFFHSMYFRYRVIGKKQLSRKHVKINLLITTILPVILSYDVIGLTETRRRHPLNAVYETGEELFLGTCDSRGVGGVGVLVNTSMAKNIDSFEQLTTRIGRLRMRRCGPIPALTIFVVYAPTSSYEEEEVEAFYMDLEKFYQEDHAFYKVIVGYFNAKVGPRRTPEELHIGTHGLQWNDQGERLSEFIMTTKTIHGNSQFQKPSSLRWTWESPGGGYRNEIDHIIVNKRFCLTDVSVVPKFYTGSDHRLLRGRFSFTRRAEKAAKFRERNPRTTINWDLFATLAGFWEDSAMDNIDEEYDRLVEHLHDCAKKAESFKTTRRRLSLETLELIRQRGAARAAGNQELTSELARLCREAIKEDLKGRRAEVLAEAAEAGKSIRYARRDFASRKTRMTALRNPKGTAIASRRGMEKIIYDFYSDLFDSHVHLPPHHLREDGQVIPEVLPSEIRHAIMSVRNRTAPGPDRIRPEHLKSLPPVLINTLARLFTRYLSECKVPKQWKTSKTVLLYKKGDPHDIGNYRPICLLSVIYKLFTRVILNRIEKVLDEGQPCEQAGFRKGFSTIDHIHTVSKLIEVSREYKMPLCLTFIDLKKAFDSVETEAVVEALDNQGVPTQYIKVLRELHSNFTTGISPFYKNIIIDVKRGVRQGDTISPKIFTATLENAMRKLEWDDMGVKVDGRQLHHLRFADDIVLVTPSISQAERMLTEFDETCGCIGLQLNLQKTMFMRNGWVSDAPFTLNGTNISECTSYVYLGRELNMMNDLTPELGRRRRAAWGAYKSIEDVVKKTRNTRLRAHLFNTTVLPALTYASETWAFRKQEENAVSVIERAIERVMLGVSRFTQVRDGIRSSLLRQRSKIRDAAAFAKESKIRWAGHVMRFDDNRWTRAIAPYIPPLHFNTVMEIAIREHPEYNLEEYGRFGGFYPTTDPCFVICSLILYAVPFFLPIVILYWRHLILKAFNSHGGGFTEKTRSSSRLLLKALTAQALMPLLCTVPFGLLYFTVQFTGQKFAPLEYLFAVFITLPFAIDPDPIRRDLVSLVLS